MAHRDLNSFVATLADFLMTDPACKQAAQQLGRGVEIGIIVENQIDCTFFRSVDGAGFEIRKAKNPDVIFHLTSSAVDTLCSQPNRNIGELGVEVLKLYVAHEVKIQVPGSLFSIMKNGYLKIIAIAGLPFAKFLAENGVSNLSKIPELIKRLKG